MPTPSPSLCSSGSGSRRQLLGHPGHPGPLDRRHARRFDPTGPSGQPAWLGLGLGSSAELPMTSAELLSGGWPCWFPELAARSRSMMTMPTMTMTTSP